MSQFSSSPRVHGDSGLVCGKWAPLGEPHSEAKSVPLSALTSDWERGDDGVPLFRACCLVDEFEFVDRNRNGTLLAKEDEAGHGQIFLNPAPRRSSHRPSIVRDDQSAVGSGPLENRWIISTFKARFPYCEGVSSR